MATEWSEFCKASEFTCRDGAVEVQLRDGRRQSVAVEDHGDFYLLRSTVARAAAVQQTSEAILRAWERNRSVFLVGFRIDARGRMIGEARLPKIGLTAEEWQFTVIHVAQECDRFEFQLTGQDSE